MPKLLFYCFIILNFCFSSANYVVLWILLSHPCIYLIVLCYLGWTRFWFQVKFWDVCIYCSTHGVLSDWGTCKLLDYNSKIHWWSSSVILKPLLCFPSGKCYTAWITSLSDPLCFVLLSSFLPIRLCLCCVDGESWTEQQQDRTFLIVLPTLALASHLSVGPQFVICDPECPFFAVCMHVCKWDFFPPLLRCTTLHECTVLHVPNLAIAAFHKHCPNLSWPFFRLYKSVGGVYCFRTSVFRCQ